MAEKKNNTLNKLSKYVNEAVDKAKTISKEQVNKTIEEVSKDGLKLEEYVGFQDNPEIVLAAVGQNIDALQFVKKSLLKKEFIEKIAEKTNKTQEEIKTYIKTLNAKTPVEKPVEEEKPKTEPKTEQTKETPKEKPEPKTETKTDEVIINPSFISDEKRAAWRQEALSKKVAFVASENGSTLYNVTNLSTLEKVASPRNIGEVTAFAGGSYNDVIAENVELLTRYSLALSSDAEFEKFYKEKTNNPKAVLPNSLKNVLAVITNGAPAGFNKIHKSFEFIKDDVERINANFQTSSMINDFNKPEKILNIIESQMTPKKVNTLGITALNDDELTKLIKTYPEIQDYKDKGKKIFVDNDGNPIIGTANSKINADEVGVFSKYEDFEVGPSILTAYNNPDDEQKIAFGKFTQNLGNHIVISELSKDVLSKNPQKKVAYTKSSGKLYFNKNLNGYEKVIEGLYAMAGSKSGNKVNDIAKIKAVEFVVRGLDCFSPEVAKNISGELQQSVISKLNLIIDDKTDMDSINKSTLSYIESIYTTMGIDLKDVPAMHAQNGFYYKPIKRGAESFEEFVVSPYTHDERFKTIINVKPELDEQTPEEKENRARGENNLQEIEKLSKFEMFPKYDENLEKWSNKYTAEDIKRNIERDNGEKLASLMNNQINLLLSCKNKKFYGPKLKKAISDATAQISAILELDEDDKILQQLEIDKVKAILSLDSTARELEKNIKEIGGEMKNSEVGANKVIIPEVITPEVIIPKTEKKKEAEEISIFKTKEAEETVKEIFKDVLNYKPYCPVIDEYKKDQEQQKKKTGTGTTVPKNKRQGPGL